MPGKAIRNTRGVPQKINGWKELGRLENDQYRIEEHEYGGCGWIVRKRDSKAVAYLSTHLFYKECTGYDKILSDYGFNVELIKVPVWGDE